MSLSNDHHKFQGRVFLAVETPGPNETTVQEIEGKKRLIWDEAMDEEFLSRVRTKAQTKAKEILAQAMREAEEIKAAAHGQGLEQGLSEGRERIEAQLASMGETLGQALSALENQGRQVWQAREADMVSLVRLAVEKTLDVELSERREEVLHTLLGEALERIESHRGLILRTAPQDTELIAELVERAKDKFPDIKHFKVKPQAGLDAGVVVEAEDGKADNSLPTRWQGVAEILDKLGVSPAKTQDQG